MSHFSVLVVTDKPGKEELARVLQPYHEFESTGIDDEHISEVDITEEIKKDYEEHGDGRDFLDFAAYWSGYEPLAIGKELDVKGHHKYGYTTVTVDGLKVIRRTNQSAKWDWWQLGGRYTGFLISRGASLTGEPGLTSRRAREGTCDQCRVGDLDIDAMLELRKREYAESWSQAQAEKAMRDLDAAQIDWLYGIKEGMTKDEYIAQAKAISCFAILDEEGWKEEGKMGWFGISIDDDPNWDTFVQRYVDELLTKPDKWVAIVDCHI